MLVQNMEDAIADTIAEMLTAIADKLDESCALKD